ncbi:hypothetical protein BACCIP111895_04688 [Neobacillus rhizosphaerae]|uniref:DUF4306 domain-containing protein n=1 Tax=Neobacillus rhizosphaerae TaxID=2880965 RepID=A0ABM9EZ60_9BACI|nr:hypothetical protein [Neobacillus rhizosphaerae]CAH2717474.1 hypothetical protein BACCIP111895_04688 [Neobacillus rhizosphaerae]
MIKRKFLVLLFLIANLLVLLSPFFSKSSVSNYDDLKNAAFGFPFPFVNQDLSSYDPPFPYVMSISSSWENPMSINLLSLIASLFVVNVPIYFIYYVFGLLRK